MRSFLNSSGHDHLSTLWVANMLLVICPRIIPIVTINPYIFKVGYPCSFSICSMQYWYLMHFCNSKISVWQHLHPYWRRLWKQYFVFMRTRAFTVDPKGLGVNDGEHNVTWTHAPSPSLVSMVITVKCSLVWLSRQVASRKLKPHPPRPRSLHERLLEDIKAERKLRPVSPDMIRRSRLGKLMTVGPIGTQSNELVQHSPGHNS